MKKNKVMRITAVTIVIVLISGAIVWKMLGIRAEGETSGIDTSKWDKENRVNIVYDTEGIPVPVPKGYTASSVDGEHTVNTGFVIYEGEEPITDIETAQKQRNQWVWVPLSNVNTIYSISNGVKKAILKYNSRYYSEPTITSTDQAAYISRYLAEENQIDLYDEIQKDFENTISSISKYGGFYIGRYETSRINYTTGKLATVKGIWPYQYTWYTFYRSSKSIMENENKNVMTSMMWGCLWDSTVDWLVSSGSKTKKEIETSTSWGNYENVEFDYTDSNGNIVSKTGWRGIPTGSTEYTKANNIYDMAGNVWEWTLSGTGGDRTLRGGTYYDYAGRKGSVISYWNYNPNYTASGQSAGSRAILYIK